MAWADLGIGMLSIKLSAQPTNPQVYGKVKDRRRKNSV